MPPRLAAMASSSAHHGAFGDRGNGDDTDMDDSHSVELEQVDVDTLYLQPAAFKRNEKGKWQESGKTIAFGLSPINGEIATWIAPRVSPAAPSSI